MRSEVTPPATIDLQAPCERCGHTTGKLDSSGAYVQTRKGSR